MHVYIVHVSIKNSHERNNNLLASLDSSGNKFCLQHLTFFAPVKTKIGGFILFSLHVHFSSAVSKVRLITKNYSNLFLGYCMNEAQGSLDLERSRCLFLETHFSVGHVIFYSKFFQGLV